MSLINDMLSSLDTRRPDDLARLNLQREIRALPVPRGQRRPWLWLLLALFVLGGAAAALYLNPDLLSRLGLEPPAVVTPAPVPVVAAPVTPPAPAIAVADTVPPPLPAADELRFSPTLSALPTTAQAILPIPDPVLPLPSRPEVREAPPTPAAASIPAPAGPSRIEKSPVLAVPRDRAEAEFRRGEAAQQAGRSGDAQEALRAALKIDPLYVPPRQMLLRLLLEQRKFDDAVAILREGLEAQPQQVGWAMSLARLQLEHGELAAADATLTRSQAYADNNADYAGFQGHLKSRLGVPKQALAHYQRAARLAPGEGRWWLGQGLALVADGHPAEARDAFRRAMASGTLNAELAAVAEQHLRP